MPVQIAAQMPLRTRAYGEQHATRPRMKKMLIVGIGVVMAATASGKPAPKDRIEPKAIDALKTMGSFLRSQQSFSVQTISETDYELDNGQTVRMQKQGDLHVRRPDHLRANVTSDRKDRQFFYDGKTFVMYAPKLGYYTKIDAPPTLNGLADTLETQYGVELPMVDLFRWGTAEAPLDQLTSAQYIGPATVDGVQTDQYAFRQKGADWQLWIERGDKPVPRKILITTTDDPARPQHSVVMAWRLDDKQPDSTFTFNPPKTAAQIDIQPNNAPAVSRR
jgi:hypothetical protein